MSSVDLPEKRPLSPQNPFYQKPIILFHGQITTRAGSPLREADTFDSNYLLDILRGKR